LFYFAQIPHLRDYSNLNINVCMEENLSKTFYMGQSDFIPRFAKDIKGITATGKTYVVCYKDYKSEYERELNNEPQITIEHYGSTKGANHLIENVNIVCTGILNKSEPHYLSKTISLDGKVCSFDSTTTDKVRRFVDPMAESVKIYDMVKDLVQEIFRTQIRDHSSNITVNVYLSTRDPNIIHLLKTTFPGCSVNCNWAPKAIMGTREIFRKYVAKNGNAYNTKTKLVNSFLELGHELTPQDLIDVLGVDIKNAGRYLKE